MMRCSFVSLVLLLAASSAAPAQTFYGIAGGLNFLGPIPDSLHDSRGFAVKGLLNVDPPGPWARLYLIAGTGAYYLYQQPGATGAVRFGVSAGAGFVVPVRGRSRVFVEARYHDLAPAPAQPRWLVPVTMGVIF